MKFFFLWTIILVLQTLQFSEAAPTKNEIVVEPEYRLPTTIWPQSYTITLTTYINEDPSPETKRKRFEFDGLVKISITTKEEKISQIVLHKKDIEVESCRILKRGMEENSPIVTKEDYNEVTELYTLELSEPLEKDVPYILEIKYVGVMKDDMKGFYKSNYIDGNGKEVWIGSTQFQTHHARRAFPCFDEPQFKATFDISINHEAYYEKIYSNMQQKNNKDLDNGRHLTTFQTTPKMSTYLVAFLVSNFDGPEENKFSVIARPEYRKQTEYSFNDGQKLLAALSEYTKIDYYTLGVDKMHMAAIPDFSAGAMENWGLLTYRERGLLYDREDTTDMAQQSIALVIAHEQTHMWFGDYVTCDWWNHTWLNEGFARYFQYVAAHKVYSQWGLDKQFVIDQIHSVFVTDSLGNTHPMSDKNINTPTDLAKMFDSISYNKGASVIRMFKYAMGEDKFQAALQSYLKKRAHDVTKPEYLFEAFEQQWSSEAKVNQREFFLDWTEQVGYPVVSLKVVDDGKAIEVSQQRFLLEENAGDKTLKYTIPFTYTTQKKPDFDPPKPENIRFFKDTDKFDLSEKLGESDYIIANIEQIGYFRVLYEDNMLNNIRKALLGINFSEIGVVNRAHLIDDLFNFGRAGTLTYTKIFDIVSYLQLETQYLPWAATFNGLKFIEEKLGSDNQELKNLLHKIIRKVYDHLGFDHKTFDDSRLDVYNRANVLQWACKYDFRDCNEKSEKLFKEFKDDQKKIIDKNIRSAVYCSAVRRADDLKYYNFLADRYKNTKSATEKTLILSALGCVKSETHVEAYYKFILSENVRKQDKNAAINSLIAENPENAENVFKLIDKDHKALSKALVGGDDDVATVINNIAKRFSGDDQKKLIEKFLDKELSQSAKDTIRKGIENIDKNMNWLKNYKDNLIQGLKGGVSAKSISIFLITFGTLLCYYLNY